MQCSYCAFLVSSNERTLLAINGNIGQSPIRSDTNLSKCVLIIPSDCTNFISFHSFVLTHNHHSIYLTIILTHHPPITSVRPTSHPFIHPCIRHTIHLNYHCTIYLSSHPRTINLLSFIQFFFAIFSPPWKRFPTFFQ